MKMEIEQESGLDDEYCISQDRMRKAELLLQKVIVCVVKMSIQHETTGKDKRSDTEKM